MKEMRIGKPITVGDTTIIPLERESIRVHHAGKKDGLSVQFSKEPIGIVVGTPQGKWAIDIHGEQVPLESYIREFHGLQEVLDSL